MSPPGQILVSILIVVHEDCEALARVLESVLPLKGADAEVIVVDGGSRDGTVELLRGYGSQVDRWISEPDRGVYDAMNKAIAAARGTFFYHINAGDRLLYLPIDELRAADAAHVDVAAFAVMIDGVYAFRPTAGWRLRINNTLHHQGTFYRRASFPGYDLRYRVFADFDVNQRLQRCGARIRLHRTVVADHSADGLSNQPASWREMFRVVAANQGSALVPLSWLDCKWHGLLRRMSRYHPA